MHTSIPNAQVSRAGLLVWYGGAAAIRGGQAGGGSHSAGCAVHPTGTPVQPTSSTTSAQLSLQFSSRAYNRQLIMTSSYLIRLRTDNISSQDQDSQFSLLPTTSVARGEKSSDPSKITAAELPHSGSANSSKKKVTFAELAHEGSLAAYNAAILPSGAARCCAYKKGSDIRCSRPAYPGSFFCSQDHSGWDTKANGTTHRVYTEAAIGEDGAPQATPGKPGGAPNRESSHSGDKLL